jgi:hypothetical protein
VKQKNAESVAHRQKANLWLELISQTSDYFLVQGRDTTFCASELHKIQQKLPPPSYHCASFCIIRKAAKARGNVGRVS